MLVLASKNNPKQEIESKVFNHQHTKSKDLKRDMSLDHLYIPGERLYYDHQNYLEKLDNIRDMQDKSREEFQITKKSKYL